MPISVTGSDGTPLARLVTEPQAGFTLVELMVVIVIIGLLSAGVMLTYSDPADRVQNTAEQLAARVNASRNEAIVSGRDVRVLFNAAGYRFERRRQNEWQAINEKGLQTHFWRSGETVAAAGGTEQTVAFDPTGLASAPAMITISRAGAQASVAIDGNGDIRLVR
jgi:general secretion pathway protein H